MSQHEFVPADYELERPGEQALAKMNKRLHERVIQPKPEFWDKIRVRLVNDKRLAQTTYKLFEALSAAGLLGGIISAAVLNGGGEGAGIAAFGAVVAGGLELARRNSAAEADEKIAKTEHRLHAALSREATPEQGT